MGIGVVVPAGSALVADLFGEVVGVPGVVDTLENFAIGGQMLFRTASAEGVVGVVPPLVVGGPDVGELVEAVVAVVPDVGFSGEAGCGFAG